MKAELKSHDAAAAAAMRTPFASHWAAQTCTRPNGLVDNDGMLEGT